MPAPANIDTVRTSSLAQMLYSLMDEEQAGGDARIIAQSVHTRFPTRLDICHQPFTVQHYTADLCDSMLSQPAPDSNTHICELRTRNTGASNIRATTRTNRQPAHRIHNTTRHCPDTTAFDLCNLMLSQPTPMAPHRQADSGPGTHEPAT